MCDCAETRERLRREAAIRAQQAADAEGRHPSKKTILGLSAIVFTLLGLIFQALDRKTQRRILAMFGLGWLIPPGTCQRPSPCDSAAHACDTPRKPCCTCKK